MSYILEALKKAQAERQLGNAPTLDALPVHPPSVAGTRRAMSPLVVGVAALALLAVAGALTMRWWAPGPALTAAAPAPAVAVVTPPAVVSTQTPTSAPTPTPAAAPTPAPASAPAPALVVAPPSQPSKPAPVSVAAERSAPALAGPVNKLVEPPAAQPAPQPTLPTLRELPDGVRAGIPQVALGGYMYSTNPADRLILVDKVLRHEGDEVAPGLVLEKLLPKAAQMNYRGTRYLVPY